MEREGGGGRGRPCKNDNGLIGTPTMINNHEKKERMGGSCDLVIVFKRRTPLDSSLGLYGITYLTEGFYLAMEADKVAHDIVPASIWTLSS